MNKIFIFQIFILLSVSIYSNNLNIWSQSAILVDLETKQILFEKNKDQLIQPASMTKLVTLYMVYRAIENRSISKDDLVNISWNADYRNLPRDSSLMFIEKGQKVTLFELMKGLAIPSGNDAAIAIAEFLYGSVDNYLKEVNNLMKYLGLKNITFVDSSGYSDNNMITTSDFIEFCIIFLDEFPQALNELFSLDSFTYPKKENGTSSIGSITQFNHNPIIKIYPEADGLKTGFINSSGMNISLTAKNNERRVVAVLAGVKDPIKKDAELKRIYDSIILLNQGLNNFTNINLDKIDMPYIKVQNSNIQITQPIIAYKRKFTLAKDYKVEYSINTLTAPIKYGEFLGYAYIQQDNSIYTFPIRSNQEIYSSN